ncbi:Pre-mRNA-splicing factor of RES complex-domain-containing protein [Geopyxis carbonaria]|nr:Pre-mRNA-splicing factor of RES complex-domain-containing protein [Geopyxis carbonaria]
MSCSLASYLAKNYLTADEPVKKPKKKKRKHDASSGLTIIDDSDFPPPTRAAATADDGPTTVGPVQRTAKTTKSNWIITPSASAAAAAADTAEADAIVAANTDGRTDDPAPAIASTTVEKMSSGAHAGLQTAEQVTAQLAAAARAEAARFAAADPRDLGKGQETIYRDASGRIVNIAMKRAEARAEAEKEAAAARAVVELQKGGVQRRDEERRRAELKDAKYMTMARYADDEDLNEELKEKEVWNDPAAAFLTKKKGKAVGYQGAHEPNRYGIRPGAKWDGVDRGNGFEKKWFLAQNRRKEVQERKYTSLMDID